MLKLDPVTHDYIIENFSYAFVENDLVDVEQRLKVKLFTNRCDWFFDQTYGIPYYDDVFVVSPKKDDIDDIFKIAISQERGVESITHYESSFNPSTRKFTINAKIKKTGGGIIPISLSL